MPTMQTPFGMISHLPEIGTSIMGRAATATLYVSPNGDGSDGTTWAKAYTTIQAALDAASTDADDITLILIGPHATNYDIYTTGDPTWAANVMLMGSHRTFAKVMNTHGSATSIMKLTGKVSVNHLNFNLGSGSGNGLIFTHSGSRVYECNFIGEDLTGAATALWLDHATTGKFAKVTDSEFKGHVTYMTGILVDKYSHSLFDDIRICDCLKGIQIVGATATENQFCSVFTEGCAIGFDIDAGTDQHLCKITFHENTLNIDDEAGAHFYTDLYGDFPITITPTDLVGTTLASNATLNVYGTDTELRAAAAATKPFRVIGVIVEPAVAQWYQIRLSADSGSTFFEQVMVSTARAAGSAIPSGTGYIFNAGTRISGSCKAESSGPDNIKVWLKIQEI